jgi:2-phospho-L-lactate transferase
VREPACVVNTADDLEYLGLRVCPDVDSVLYALAGCFDEERGWGVRGDTFRCNEALARFGDDWFHVGDADLATHLERTALLRAGRTLSEAMAEITGAWSIRARVVLALQCSIEEFAYVNFVEAVGPGIHPPVTVDEAARVTSTVWVSTFRTVLMPE